MKRALVAAAVALAAIAMGSCGINDYCVQCASSHDGGAIDAADGDAIDGGEEIDATPCVPTGVEVCNNLDDDCNGMIDDNIPGVGDPCGTDVGECTTGVRECANGVMRCTGVAPTAELCNDKDDNCNGMTDEGDPGGGTPCGSDVGECVAGLNHCIAGQITCVGSIGTPGANPEICDGKDNDCDNQFDEDIPAMGSCGTTDVGECSFGQLMCVGGVPTCLGEVGPSLELCDNLDQDCDGNNTDGFNLNTDPRNCGACNHVCDLPHATEGCANGQCTIASCDPGWHDANGMVGDGCEYQCDVTGVQEACNGIDEDCDGNIDEGVVAPDICDHDGACAGTVATCGHAAGWQCNYPATVSTDATGAIVPESTCDGIDNDCDTLVDESHPLKGTTCGDNGMGICQGRGTNQCNPADPSGPVTCVITQPGQPMGVETCNNLDDDCDGIVDDNPTQDWVSIGGGHQIMKYEASHPDATALAGGNVTTLACSKPGVLPWTNVTYLQARAACNALGADLCTEQDWTRACSVITKTGYPFDEPAANSGYMFFEGEDYAGIATGVAGGVTRAWVPDTAPTGVSGMGGLKAAPDSGASVTLANAPGQSPRLDYTINFAAGAHYVWVRMYGPSDSSDAVHVGINPVPPGVPTVTLDAPSNGGWVWVRGGPFNIAAAGTQTVSLWMAEDGVKVDAVVVTQSASATAPTEVRPAGGTWSYAANPTVAQPAVCNDDNLDTNPLLGGDQDDIVVGGSQPMCYANWSATDHVFDLSGNVKEWTLARSAGANPLRGGASNNETTGITCRLAFTLASDTFFFPNVGFRCCK
ncbi:MAG TPA: MopE-related protein [Kofleriaceae bacterium]|nr:MopE-related protein [Kofleriaceae bacterium]